MTYDLETAPASSDVITMPAPVTDIAAGKATLDEYGLVVHENVLTREQVEALKERLDEQAELERKYDVALVSNQSFTGTTWYGGADGRLPAWQNVTMLVNKGRIFMDLILKNPLVHEYCAHAFGGVPYQLSSTSGIIQRHGCEAMTVHTDQQWVPVATATPVFLNFFFCLSDFDEDMGATRVVPKSHLGPPPELVFDPNSGAHSVQEAETLPIVCEAGDMFSWEGRIWHQSGASSSEKVRYSVGCIWGQSWVKPIDNFLQSLHDDVYEGLSPEELDLLGFRVDAAGRMAPRRIGDRQSTNRKVPYIPELRRGADNVIERAPGERGNVDSFGALKSGSA
ncbi:phytanoyl-CoA dioxygenase family protein [Mycobacterium sp. URHB0044]|uniref:phytanoyl-CoA dioxygenase family protein n=1 Tax=Mycobacterium sp. URHB0044 TaxID=1380386 RepID=UPI00048A5AE0|nr:phytanoyl-CoA dioxygenase family protein [Mycobacterium sp. URHB0044]